MRKTLRSLVGVALALSLVSGGAIASADTGSSERKVKPQRVKILAHDNHFMGVPDQLKAKRTVLTFKNKGAAPHMAVIIKMLHGKTLKQLLKMPNKKVQKHIKEIGFLHAKPGTTSKKKIDAKLTKGRYAMLCFVQDSKDSPPHFIQGMIHKFRVVAK